MKITIAYLLSQNDVRHLTANILDFSVFQWH